MLSRRMGIALGLTLAAVVVACSASKSRVTDDDDASSGSGTGGAAAGTGGGLAVGVGGGGAGGLVGDPKTCEEAAQAKTYIGCDFWPTVVPNAVWSIFDYAAVVANTGDNVVDVTVERNGSVVATAQIAPNSLETVYLPWVPELKGPDADSFGGAQAITQSIRANGGAYHLTTNYPVTVYQFSALQYAPQGGPPGKNWNLCPADGIFIQCFSYSNDASLLVPTTAMTGNYRVFGHRGLPGGNIPAYAAVTATENGTTVNLKLGGLGGIAGGGGLSAVGANGTTSVVLDSGDVFVFLANSDIADLSGALVNADKPVQVISGVSCVNVPEGAAACDHIEETVFPAETLGQHYVVARPTGPKGVAVGHQVILYGNFDGTTLTYSGTPPPGAPSTLSAGQVIDLGIVNVDFEVEGSNSFAVSSFEQGGSVVDPGGLGIDQLGDPAHSMPTAVEQYRKKYVFLAPTDYPVNFVDVVRPATGSLLLNGQAANGQQSSVGSYVIERISLSSATGGVHVLEGDQPFGIQVTGYGSYTSYYYPGGLNLGTIAPPPLK